MTYIPYFFILLIGLSLGSFLSVLVSRLSLKGGILLGRSECPNCSTIIRWFDLIPIVSFIRLRGRCRDCRTEISAFYVLIEAISAGILILFFWIRGFDIGLIGYLDILIIMIFISLVFFDIRYFILPDKIVFPLIVLSFFRGILIFSSDLGLWFISSFSLSIFFAIMYIVSQGKWMGFGDAKLMLATGLVLGYPLNIISLIVSVWIAGIFGISLIILGRANRKTALPFGAFISAVSIIILIFQNEIQSKIKFFNQLF